MSRLDAPSWVCCLSDLSWFPLWAPQVCFYGDATQHLSLWSVAPASEIYSCRSLSASAAGFVSIVGDSCLPLQGRREPFRLLMRLSVRDTPVVSWPWEVWGSSAGWAFLWIQQGLPLLLSFVLILLIGAGCCLSSPIKRAREAQRGG